MQTIDILASLCSWVCWLVHDLVTNPKEMFSLDDANSINIAKRWRDALASCSDYGMRFLKSKCTAVQ